MSKRLAPTVRGVLAGRLSTGCTVREWEGYRAELRALLSVARAAEELTAALESYGNYSGPGPTGLRSALTRLRKVSKP
jgi:hypothetical protein